MFDLVPFRRGENDFLTHFDQMEKNLMQNFGGHLAAFKTDIIEQDDKFILKAELPGFEKKDINIHVDDQRLTITAEHNEKNEENTGNYICRERRFGSFSRSFDVSNIKTEDIRADYKNGVLILDLPKKDHVSSSARKIDIN